MKKRLCLLMIGVVLCVAGCATDSKQKVIVTDEVVKAVDGVVQPTVEEAEFETKETTEVGDEKLVVEEIKETGTEETAIEGEYTLSEEDLNAFAQQEVVVFDGIEITLPCKASVLTDMGWIPNELTIVDESKSSIMMHEKYPDNSLSVMASVKNFTGVEQSFEDCILFALDVKNSYLGGVLEEYADMSYKGVEFGMSKDEVISLMGEPNDVTVSEDSVFAEQTGTCTILRYADLGVGRAVEIWHYGNLGVTRIDVQVITS